MKNSKTGKKVTLVTAALIIAILCLLTGVVIMKHTNNLDDHIDSTDCTVQIDGKHIQADNMQKEQIESAIIENIDPMSVLDILWSKEQIAEMAKEGLFIECSMPKEKKIFNQKLVQYYVIANEQSQYLVIVTDKGVQTFEIGIAHV